MAQAMTDRLTTEGEAPAGAAHQPPPKPRKKSAKTLAKEAAKAQEEEQISLSIRGVPQTGQCAARYEPDPAERERKTALMQRANEAYANKNLLQLLELQLELEHIDAAHLANLAPERLL